MNPKYPKIIIVLIALVILCIPSLFLSPSYSPSSEVNAVDTSTLATDVSRDIRIAIYSETNTTEPSYTEGFGGAVHNNATGMRDILELAGYTNIDIVTVKNISEHYLVTAKYDVFMIIDNFPRENITHLIWDFWAGGGGILSLDRSGIFLCYTGILPPESAGSSGYGVYWAQMSDDMIINVRHPISQSYSLPTIIPTSGYYLTWDWGALSASSIGSNLEGVAHSTYGVYAIDVLTYEPDSGGKVVSLKLDLVTDQTPEAYPLIQDSVDWLCPRPKARIAFDFSHMPRLGVDDHDLYTYSPGEYSELRNSSVEHGCTFDKLYPTKDGNITYDRLFNGGYAGYDLLILVLPDYAYSSQELVDIDRWVSEGHSLLVFAETGALGQFSNAVVQINNVLENMDCQINMDEYAIASAPQTCELHLTNEYAYYLSMNVHGFINITGPDAYGLWKTGSDITMAASEYVNGRVIVSADMNWATDDQISLEDNAQYLINAINWLTSAEVNIFLFTDETLSLNHYRTPVANALNDLGYRYYLVRDPNYLPMVLNDQHWDIVIIDNVGYHDLDSYLSDLLTFVNQGGRLLMSTCDTHHSPGHDLWAALGFELAAPAVVFDPTHIWNAYHSIFNIPHNYTTGHFTPEITYGTPGDYLTVTNGTALGGWFVIPRDGNASIVLGASQRTLFNSFVIDEFTNDLDDSAYPDNFELWENEIAYMMRPLLTHPDDVYMIEGDDEEIIWDWDPPAQLYGAPVYWFELRINETLDSSGFLGGAIEGGLHYQLSMLTPGLHIFEFMISGRFGLNDTDTVLVYVEEVPPVTYTPPTTTATYTTPTTTTTTTPTTTTETSTTDTTTEPSTTPTDETNGIPEIYLVGLAIGGIGIIVILVAIFYKTKPVPATLSRALEWRN